ncbi:MAG: hypothetical protein EOO94_04630, partial [Pedobacter sp.]
MNYTADSIDNLGISLRTFSKINLDTVFIYPTVANKPYQIALMHKAANNTYSVMDTYNGVTLNNHYIASVEKKDMNFFTATPDTNTNLGVTFRAFDSLVLNSVKIYPSQIGVPFQIDLKRNGTVVNSYTGLTDSTTQVVNLNFGVYPPDSNSIYNLVFASNPLINRDAYAANTSTIKYVPGVIRILNDTAQGKHNYFYDWKVAAYNYTEPVPVNFLIPRDTAADAYKIVFTDNPGAKRDLGTTTSLTVPDGLTINTSTDQGYYNYFYNWKVRTNYFKFYSPAEALTLFGDASKIYIDYPDTANSQNVMDYTYCSKMFTYLQTVRMRNTLKNNVAFRDNLVSTSNLAFTGALDAW